ncbi:MAG: glycosyltransferase family 39 protein [Candidatus Eisenbacteria bacterium]
MPPTPAANPSPAVATARRESPLPLLAVLAGALLLRLTGLGSRSLWTDEGSTWTAASAPLRELIRLCAEKDASPPLFYLLTSLALKFGDSEALLRAVSMVASLGMVYLTYRFARLLAARSEATLAAMIVALSPHQIMFGQEARTYMLVALFTTWSLYLFARAVVTERQRSWVPFVLVTALALWTQGIAILGLGVQGAIAVFTAPGRRHLWRWGLAVVAAFALYSPWLAISASQASRLGHSHWYLQTPDGHELFQVLRAVFLSPVPLVTPTPTASLPGLEVFLPRRVAHAILIALPALPLIVALRSASGGGTGPAIVRLAFLGLFLPLIAVDLISFRMPLWLPRYFVFVTPMLALVLARGLSSLRPRALGSVWAALLLLSSGYACFRYATDYGKEPWRDAVEHIATTGAPGRTAALVPFDLDAFRYYNLRQPVPVAAYEVSHPEVPFASSYTEAQLIEMERVARDRAARFDEVWVVVRSPNSEIRRELARRTERAAASDGRVLMAREIWNSMSGAVRLARYRRPAAGDSGAAGRTSSVR